MSRGQLAGVGCLLAAALAGCPEEEAEERRRQPAAEAAGAPEEREAVPPAQKREKRAPPEARVVRPGDGGAESVSPGGLLEPEDGPWTVRLAWSGEIRLGPRARARLGNVAPAQVVLARGWARMVRSPSGAGRRAPLRLATPTVTVVVPTSGRAWVAVPPGGRTWLAVTAGEVEVELAAGVEEAPRGRRVPAGKQVWVDGKLGATQPLPEGDGGLEDAAEARAVALAGRSEAGEGGESPEEALARLDAVLAERDTQEARGRALSEAHRRALGDDANRAAELRREIVGHSRALISLHRRLLVTWERAAAQALAAGTEEILGERTRQVRRALAGQP
ncbi:MAG: hypothetical protein ACODAU_10515 [Myxococcota bacterium]